MDNKTYILVNDELRTFTYLHRFNANTHSFEGEHSLLHNRFANDGYFLSKFLMASVGKSLVLMNSSHERYQEIIQTYTRFLENDIEKRVEEKLYKDKEDRIDTQMDKDLGALQVSIIKMMFEKKLEDTKKSSNEPGNDSGLLLGKELALEWALHTITDIIERGKN